MSQKNLSSGGDENESFMYKVATFIVDRRNLFFLLWIFAIIFSVFARNWVSVENDITTYLPDTTETRQGLTLMDEQFTTYGSASVMVSNITYEKAAELSEDIEEIEGVSEVAFDDTGRHIAHLPAARSALADAVKHGLYIQSNFFGISDGFANAGNNT